MIPDLPYAQQARHARTPLRLHLPRDIPSVPGLVDEEQRQRHREHLQPQRHPEDVAPLVRAGDDEIAQHWPHVRTGEEDGGPDANLPRVLVEEVHVLDEGEAARLARGEEEAHQRAQAVVAGKVGRQCRAQGEERADGAGPEEDWGAAPAGYERDPEYTADAAVGGFWVSLSVANDDGVLGETRTS